MAWSTGAAGQGNSAAGASFNVNCTATIAAGSLVIFCVTDKSTSAGGSVTDSGGNTYTPGAAGVSINGNAANGFGRLFYSVLTTGLTSSSTFTYTKAVSGSACVASAMWATGNASSSVVDSAVINNATGTGTAPSVTSGTPGQSGELFVAFLSANSSVTITQDSTHNWAVPPNNQATGGGTAATVGGGNQVNAGSGTIIYSPTVGSSNWAVQVFGFNPPASDTFFGQAVF